MGPTIRVELKKPGFYPAGGGKMTVSVKPCLKLTGIELTERGKVLRRSARAIVANLPRTIAKRELAVIRDKMGLADRSLTLIEVTNSSGLGNVVFIEVTSDKITELFTGFGEKGVRAEQVAAGVVKEAKEYIKAKVPAGKNLADQLLIPVALAGKGRLITLPLTDHAKTNIEVIKKFVDLDVDIREINTGAVEINLRGGSLI